MATFDGADLKAWRASQGVSAADLAERISCDVTTVYRYESGKLKPDPDVMYQICRALGDTRKWQIWMRTEYPISYAREHPEPGGYDLPGSVLSLYGVVSEIKKFKGRVFTDAADGAIDDPRTRAEFRRLAEQLIQAGQSITALLPEREVRP
ncbi:MAG: helix-turn-helix transcriptional regulator [Oscillospiraceae bacterium]|nr:helix-turn-helix transcriptional regulator [Oscillospiraceae bacterium]